MVCIVEPCAPDPRPDYTTYSPLRASLPQEFNELVPESHPFRDPLLKIFQRRIKRSRKIMGDEDDEDESGSDDDSDMDDGDFEDSDAEDEEACPPDCDKLVYEKVCELRERRLDEEDVLVELQKSIEAFKKEQDQAGKKLAGMEKILKSIKADILEFQKEKQQALVRGAHGGARCWDGSWAGRGAHSVRVHGVEWPVQARACFGAWR